MATMQSEIEASKKAKGEKPQKVPTQEPKFWTKYSPHHEFPLSAVSSVFAHILVLGAIALVLTGFLGTMFHDNKPVPVEAIQIAGGGGGDPDGIGDRRDGVKPQKAEAVTQEKTNTPLANADKSVASPLEATTPKTTLPKEETDSTRFINQDELALSSSATSDAAKKLNDHLTGLIRGQGQGGPGSGGGQGSGVGTGRGDGIGPGTAPAAERIKRKNRWVMIFSTRSGLDYARQLSDLGAILAVRAGSDTDYMIYENLAQRPVSGRLDDVTKINRIFWIDDNRDSVRSLCEVLGISPIPDQLVAFFPMDLENELRSKEARHYSGNEDDIELTRFKIVARGGKYTPEVQNVVRKKPGRR